MRNPINKRLKRDFTGNLGRYLIIFVFMVTTISGISSFFINQEAAKEAFYRGVREGIVEDGQMTFSGSLNDDQFNLLKENDINLYENFYIEDNMKDQKVLRVFKNREHINLPEVHEGRLPETKKEICVERIFAENNSLDIGSSMEIGGEEFEVTGTISTPDYNTLLKSRGDIMMDGINFGTALVTDEGFKRLDQKKITYTYSYRLHDRDMSLKEQTDKLIDMNKQMSMTGAVILDSVIKENNANIMYMIDDMDADVPTMITILALICVIMAFIFTIVTKSTIEDEAPIIGTLYSMGYKKREILGYYMKLPVIITVISALLGNILAYGYFKNKYQKLYLDSFSMYEMRYQLDTRAFLLTTLIPMGIIFLVTFINLFTKLNYSPLKFLRRDLKKGKKKNAVKLPDVSFIRRFRMRVFLQNKANYLVLLIGIFLANILLVLGFASNPIFEEYVDSMERELPANYQYVLKVPVEAEDGEKMTVTEMETEKEVLGSPIDVQMIGIDSDNEFIGEFGSDEGSDKAYISKGLMRKLGLKEGDEIKLYNKFIDETLTLEVAGKNNTTCLMNLYMNRETLNDFLNQDEDYFNGYYSDEELDIDEVYIRNVIEREDLKLIGEQFVKFLDGLIPMVKGISVIIYIAVIYILTKLIIERSATDIAYLQVFGYRRREISRIYINVSTIAVILFFIILAPAVDYAAKNFLYVQLLKLNGYVEPIIPLTAHLKVFLTGIVIYFIVRIFQVRKISRTDINEALKNVQG